MAFKPKTYKIKIPVNRFSILNITLGNALFSLLPKYQNFVQVNSLPILINNLLIDLLLKTLNYWFVLPIMCLGLRNLLLGKIFTSRFIWLGIHSNVVQVCNEFMQQFFLVRLVQTNCLFQWWSRISNLLGINLNYNCR